MDPLIEGAWCLQMAIDNQSEGPGYSINGESILSACKNIADNSTRTPVMSCSYLDKLSASPLVFKCENFQKSGSFKFRGACNAVKTYRQDSYVTESSGNHGQALALAGSLANSKVTVVAPLDAPVVKISAMEGYGATVLKVKPEDRAAESQKIDAFLVHPSNDPHVMSGQGTLMVEFYAQCKDLDVVVVPIGGGGLASGVAVAAKLFGLVVIAAEPSLADDAFRSKQLGQIQGHRDNIIPSTMADGLRTTLGSNTWPIVRDLVDCIVTVDEEEISSAMRLLFERMKIVVEGSSATGLAAVLSPKFDPWRGKRIGIVLTGGNVSLKPNF